MQDLFYLVSDPTKERYGTMRDIGKMRTWPHVQRIKNRMALELLVDELRAVVGGDANNKVQDSSKLNVDVVKKPIRRKSTRF